MAFLREYRLKMEVTLNGSGFDTDSGPSGGNIKKTLEIPTATLSYPNPFGKQFQRFSPKDVFRIYVGRDEIPDEPTFVGYPIEGSGEDITNISLIGRLNSCETEYVFIDDYNNYDGWEVGKAIEQQLLDKGFAPSQFGQIRGTDPITFMPSDFRKPKGITRYQVMKFARDLAFDVDITTGEALKYILYEQGDGNFMLTKQKALIADNSWYTFKYASNLLSSSPLVKTLDMINRQTVFSKGGEKVVFDLDHDQNMNGIHEKQPIELDYGGVEDAYRKALFECLSKRAPTVNTKINHIELLEAVPGISILAIEDAPNLVNGFHRIVGLDIDFTGGLNVTCELEKAPPILSKEIVSMLVSAGS